MNHKRKRPKHQRAGCLFCKPWKAKNTAGGRYHATARMGKSRERFRRVSELRRLQAEPT